MISEDWYETKVQTANQRLCNRFLAAGMVWSLWLKLVGEGQKVAVFFGSCVLITGLYAAAPAAVCSCRCCQRLWCFRH